jgi:hypothetical protein
MAKATNDAITISKDTNVELTPVACEYVGADEVLVR